MKKITVSILTTLLMLSMVFSSSVFAAEKEQSAWDSFLGLFSAKTAETSDVGVEYRGHIQNVGNYPLDGSWIQGPTELGTEGKGLRLEGFWIQLDGDVPADAHIEYQVHVQNVGWMDPVQDGEFAGTEGRSLQIEAIKISLVDDEGVQLKDYSVVYTGHVQNKGDVGPYTNGEQLGTDGEFLRLEAITVEIVKNPADLDAYEAALAAVTQADYTAASWTTYQAVVNANVVDEDNLQSEVDAATANIIAAQANLVKVLKVESATALNLGQIEVKFNTTVTKTTAEDLTNNYTLVTKSGASANLTNAVATLQADGKTVLIDLSTANKAANQETRKLEIKDVKSADDQKLEKVSKDLSFFDTTLPVVQKVEQTGTKTLKVTFSEPVVNAGTPVFKINNGTYSAPTATFTTGPADRNVVTLTLGTTLPTGNYTLTVADVQDLAGFKNVSTDLTFAYGANTTAPTVAIKEVKSDAKTVVLEFSKAMDSTTLVNNAQISFSHTYNGQHAVTGTAVTKVSDTVYNVVFTDVLSPGTSNVFIDYKSGSTDAQKAKDLYGNILVLPVTLQATVIADTTAPTVVSATSTAANKIEVVFSEDVVQADAQSSSNLILRDSDNKAVSVSNLTYVAADKKTTITTTADMKAGNYTLEVKNIKDKAVVPNTITTVTKSIVVADKVAPKVDTVIYDSSANKLTVKFDKDMASTGLTTLTNYVLKVNAAQTAFPDGTVASIKDAKTVEISLGKTVTGLDGTNDSLDISGNFTDTLGNAIGGLSVNKAIVAASTVAPVYIADSAKFIAKDTLTFEVNTELQAIDPTKIVFNAKAAKNATYVNQGNKALVTVTVDDTTKLTDTASTGWAGANILDIQADALTSSFGGKNLQTQLNGSAILDKVAPFISSVDTADTTKNGQIDQLTVTLSEAVLAGSVQASDFAISDGYTVNALLSVSGSTAVLRLNESGAPDTGATPTVSIANTIEDLVGNTASTSEIVTSTDKASPVLMSAAVNYANGGTADWGTDVGDDLVLTYSEKVWAPAAGWVDAAPTFGNLAAAFTFSGGQPGDGTFTSTSINTAAEATTTVTVTVAGAVTNVLSGTDTLTGKASAIQDAAAVPNTQVVGTAVTPTYTSK